MNARPDQARSLAAFPAHGGMRALHPCGEAIALDMHQAAYLRCAAGWNVSALDGSVWITQEGDLRDVILLEGQSFVLDRDVKVLLWPLDKVRLSLTPAVRSEISGHGRRYLARVARAGARLSIA